MHGPDTSKHFSASGYVVDADTTVIISAITLHSASGVGTGDILDGLGGAIRWELECTANASESIEFPNGLVVKGAYVSLGGGGHVCVAYH